MRISDWSSDVCSSDLEGLGRLGVEIDEDEPGMLVQGDRHQAEFFRVQAGKAPLVGDSLHTAVQVEGPAMIGAAKRCRLAARAVGDRHPAMTADIVRSEEHTSGTPVTNAHLVCRLLLDKKKHKHTR